MFAGPGLPQSSALSLARQAHLLHALFVMCGCVSVCTSSEHVRQMHGTQLLAQQTAQTPQTVG